MKSILLFVTAVVSDTKHLTTEGVLMMSLLLEIARCKHVENCLNSAQPQNKCNQIMTLVQKPPDFLVQKQELAPIILNYTV